ncbi:uncharacterized protein BO97DRAFT_120310 [Aspergillus homomorphus CBS 101889]|uniref:Uncharacterized protein n=1 Tax=Aspergillus homomorphus (strain CBS 101889) TaxID=1450537 RepID=A0A395HTP6_ASPHC|nr:hypothetical protein BO97DRAFT_120310 [Aspergillus homomorphus CBS 101889]RAL10783.1 hypothetical protein BO97DRAFT_120310 [Aspergillus homomorphus CBS 101889]
MANDSLHAPTDQVSTDDSISRRKPRHNAATGASAAGIRALSAQLVAFYFRAPIKSFFRTRVDYMVGSLALLALFFSKPSLIILGSFFDSGRHLQGLLIPIHQNLAGPCIRPHQAF